MFSHWSGGPGFSSFCIRIKAVLLFAMAHFRAVFCWKFFFGEDEGEKTTSALYNPSTKSLYADVRGSLRAYISISLILIICVHGTFVEANEYK